MKKHLRRALLLTLGVVEAALPAPIAHAEQPPEEPTPASEEEQSSLAPDGAPAFRTVGFTDADVSQSCDPAAAALGGCIEEVQFLDLRAAWLNTPLDRADRARFSVIATLYASMWDDLALRWGDDDGALVDLYANSGLTALPWPDVQWESTNTARKPRISLPDTALWLDPGFWVQSSVPTADAPAPVFPLLRQAVPLGAPARPQVVLLRGRMAHGLRVGGKAHPYELMDGDPQYSGPFFEQMYPFDMGVDKVLVGGNGIDPETPCPQLPSGIADQA